MPANVETMAYRYADRSDVPWHGLGAKIDRNEEVGTYEFMVRAGANWAVLKRPVEYFANGRHLIDNDHFVLIRQDNYNPLSIVGGQYKPIQNAEIFEFFREFCIAGEMTLETAGVLDEGRRVWALAQLRDGFTLANDDRVTGHLLFSNSHAGDALHIKFTPVRVVCANTLALALGSGGGYRLNHRTRFVPDIAKSALGLSTDAMKKFKEQAEFLTRRPIQTDGWNKFLDALFPIREVEENGSKKTIIPYARERVNAAFSQAPGSSKSFGTWWTAFNAVTYDVDHRDRKDKGKQLESIWFGDGARIKQKALEVALEMAKV